MRIVYVLLIATISACSTGNSTSGSVEGLPPGAVLIDYPNTSSLKRAEVKSGLLLLEEGDVQNGKKHGSWIKYYSEGKIQTITTYIDGQKQGFEIQFDNTGYILSKSPFANGILDGEYLAYNRGMVIERKPYKNGQLNGTVYKYYQNGKVMEESNYIDGVIDGVAKWYDQEGNLKIEYTYDNGKLIQE